jgi:glycerol-1-phosphate dehydrogenase [NAD(P)+]
MKLSADSIRSFNINDYLNRKFSCECGRMHSVNIESVIVGEGAIKELPGLLNSYGCKKIYIVADTNTFPVAGERAEKLVCSADISYKKHVYRRNGDLVPDETAVGEFVIHMDKDTDMILAIGSGVLNDLCKYMSFKLGIPYIIVATAPSMDGYASVGSALILDNLKTTLPATVPKAIIGDVDILKNAPKKMLTAGFGDMVGKYSAINDWKLSSIINDEYYCGNVVQIVMDSLKRCIDNADGLQERDSDAVRNLMEGLILTGIAMSFSGNSRPASGAEHHISHFIEMMYLFEGKEAPLHGIKVGINTLIINKLRGTLSNKTLRLQDIIKRAELFDENRWAEEVKRIYKQAAPEIISLNKREKINSFNERIERIKKIIENWNEIVDTLKDIPANEEIEDVLKKVASPVRLNELGIDEKMVSEGLIYAKEVRARYTVLQLAWDIGFLEDFAGYANKYC